MRYERVELLPPSAGNEGEKIDLVSEGTPFDTRDHALIIHNKRVIFKIKNLNTANAPYAND